MWILFFWIPISYANEIHLSGNINLELVPKIYQSSIPSEVEFIQQQGVIKLAVKKRLSKKKFYKVVIATDLVSKIQSKNLNKISFYHNYNGVKILGSGELVLENYQQQEQLAVSFNGSLQIKTTKPIMVLSIDHIGILKIANSVEIGLLSIKLAGGAKIQGLVNKAEVQGSGSLYLGKVKQIRDQAFFGYIKLLKK